MIYKDTIIIGGGPAGSTCAWKLIESGNEVIILDKKKFPRDKLCAGWITPQDIKLLKLDNYPHSIVEFKKMYISFFGMKRKIDSLQYSIRRLEFDNWLLKRSKAKVYQHNVKKITKNRDYYIIDDKFKCKYLVGAGGTFCPVYKTIFEKKFPRSKKHLVTVMDQEFKYDYKNQDCYLWFFENNLNGYFWYVPKENGYINIGLGGFLGDKKNILSQWDYFIQKLKKENLIIKKNFCPYGYQYLVRDKKLVPKLGNAFIIGDSAGLATLDLAEGIGPAAKSGYLVAEAISKNKELSYESIDEYSFNNINSKLIGLMTEFKKIV